MSETKQLKLDAEYLYPTVEEDDQGNKEIIWDDSTLVVCGYCGSVMRKMSEGGGFDNLVNDDVLYSCRNRSCGGEGTAGGSTLRILITEDGVEKTRSTIGNPQVVSSEKCTTYDETGPVHEGCFDIDQWDDIEAIPE